jgi:hypothetical protein
MKPQPLGLLDLIKKYNQNIFPVAVHTTLDIDNIPQDVDMRFVVSNKKCAEHGRDASEITYVPSRFRESGVQLTNIKTPFRYFLDGCRRVYHLGDMATRSGNIVPLIAGQYSSAVIERNNTAMVSLYKHRRQSIIIIPSGAYGLDREDAEELVSEINQRFAGQDFVAQSLDMKLNKRLNEKPQDKSIAKINMAMQELEIQYLEDLTSKKMIDEDKMVIVDGVLQFRQFKNKNRAFLRYALGVAKTFDLYLEDYVEKHKQIGAHLLNLKKVGERTSCFLLHDDMAKMDYVFWYLRIQKPIGYPFAGIIKVQKALVDKHEYDDGISSESIDYLSSYLLRERNVSAYGLDFRWASHLYPIYLTEQIQKQKFINDYFFYSLLK